MAMARSFSRSRGSAELVDVISKKRHAGARFASFEAWRTFDQAGDLSLSHLTASSY